MSGEHTLKAVRGSFIDVTRTVDNPEEIASALRFIEDGLLLIKQGKVEWFGEWEDGKHQIPDTIRVRDYRGKLIVPGFVDTHIHYPQSEMVGAYGEQLLEWLNKHTFPTERRYEDLEYAREMSAFFIKQLLRNGTTTALVFGTVHPQSVDALFEAASHINMRMIAGKVMMDRNAPDYLLDTAESSYHQSKELIERWHKNGRLLYAITPRFAPTSSPEQMAMAQRLKEEYPDRKILVVDSLCASLGEGLFVYKAVQMKEAGASVDEVAAWLEEHKQNFCHVFTVDDLFHLYRGGRVSKAAAIVGTMINLKPLLHVDDEGHLIPLSKVRGRKKSLATLVSMMEERIGSWKDKNDIIFISHGDCEEDAQYVAKLVREKFGYESFLINTIGATIGTHSGPGTVALFFMGEYR